MKSHNTKYIFTTDVGRSMKTNVTWHDNVDWEASSQFLTMRCPALGSPQIAKSSIQSALRIIVLLLVVHILVDIVVCLAKGSCCCIA
jgi:hypothetical protein